jgi:hypothetical protein
MRLSYLNFASGYIFQREYAELVVNGVTQCVAIYRDPRKTAYFEVKTKNGESALFGTIFNAEDQTDADVLNFFLKSHKFAASIEP